MRPRALVFDLYGEYFRYAGGAVGLGPLTSLMAVLGVEAPTVRVVMTRLRKEGWFDSDKSGREVTYRLNDKSWHLLDEGRTRIFERQPDEWTGNWTQALLDDAAVVRERRKRIEKALNWCGFGSYSNTVWFSPHDRAGLLQDMLADEDKEHIRLLSSRSTGLAADRLIAEECWDLGELDSDYRSFIEQFRPRLGRYRRGVSGDVALVERMQLIQEYRRYPFRDPDLPQALRPAGWCGREAHSVFMEAHELLRPAAEDFVAASTGSTLSTSNM